MVGRPGGWGHQKKPILHDKGGSTPLNAAVKSSATRREEQWPVKSAMQRSLQALTTTVSVMVGKEAWLECTERKTH